jgi:Flp pilus assembly pilin Flp
MTEFSRKHDSHRDHTTELLTALLKDEDGASMAEYAVLVGVIAIVIAVSAALLGTNVNAKIDVTATKLGASQP